MARRSRKLAWTAYADARHRENGHGTPVITSLSMDGDARPIRLRLVLEHDRDRLIVVELTEAEARKMADDVVSLLGLTNV